MEADMNPTSNRLAVLASVRCLECGGVYAKPTIGGTTELNPGCPVCGYVGWIPVRLALEPKARSRSVGGRPPRLAARFR
jgi:hypothetical protein